MAKKRGGHAGGHGWFVTFADLMALMMSFFVMLVAFSTQDAQKLQIVAGSMRDAFGVQQVRFSGIVETDGLPTRPKLKNADAHRSRGRLQHADAECRATGAPRARAEGGPARSRWQRRRCARRCRTCRRSPNSPSTS